MTRMFIPFQVVGVKMTCENTRKDSHVKDKLLNKLCWERHKNFTPLPFVERSQRPDTTSWKT